MYEWFKRICGTHQFSSIFFTYYRLHFSAILLSDISVTVTSPWLLLILLIDLFAFDRHILAYCIWFVLWFPKAGFEALQCLLFGHIFVNQTQRQMEQNRQPHMAILGVSIIQNIKSLKGARFSFIRLKRATCDKFIHLRVWWIWFEKVRRSLAEKSKKFRIKGPMDFVCVKRKTKHEDSFWYWDPD